MNEELKEFIENNIDLINTHEWDQVYDNATFTLSLELTGMFTEAILKAGLNPIEEAGLDYIPQYYLSDTKITSFQFPSSNIHLLDEGCFSYSNLTHITLPESVESIADYVFYNCLNLREVTVLGHIINIGSQVFYNCSPDLVIRCEEGSVIDLYAQDERIRTEYI